MALRWTKASPRDLIDWARELRTVAAAMEAASVVEPPANEAASGAEPPADEPARIPDWLLQATAHDGG
jgi:hypothetical protein